MMYKGNKEVIYNMGVKKFNKAFNKYAAESKRLEMKEKSAAHDIDDLIWSSNRAIARSGSYSMCDSGGVPTGALNTILSMYPKMRESGYVAVFGNSKPNQRKEARREKRRGGWKCPNEAITDAMKLLTMLGATIYVADEGFEAEHYAAHLCAEGVVDYVLTGDSDSVMFGAPTTVMRCRGKFVKYELAEILVGVGVDHKTFVGMCVSLGTDFNDKVCGIGPVKVMTSGKNIASNDMGESLEDVREYILSTPTGIEINGKKDIPSAIEWLVGAKGFNYGRVMRSLKSMM
jgi:hypothetical protein